MKKILALILGLLMMASVFTACNLNESSENDEPLDNQTQSEKETEKEIEKETEKQTEKSTENTGEDNSDGTESKDPEKSETNNDNIDNNDNVNNDNGSDDNSDDENISDEMYVREGDKIIFGSYPQTQVTEAVLIETLNGMAGTLPTSLNSQAWTSYGYYENGEKSNFMWYIDIEEAGEKYRGVYFTSYRAYWPYSSSSIYSRQDENGYKTDTVYWFKYDPISWTILSENTIDGTVLIFCDMIIDSQEYQIEYDHVDGSEEYYNVSQGVPSGIYANNYEYSTIRKWLNHTFYNTAFSSLQQQIIMTTTVDNRAATTSGSSSNPYACKNTYDKVFLLSYKDVTNTQYGFSNNISNHDVARQKKTTEYAKVQGAYTYTADDCVGNGQWWLRSPDRYDSFIVKKVSYYNALVNEDSAFTDCGIVPALTIKL